MKTILTSLTLISLLSALSIVNAQAFTLIQSSGSPALVNTGWGSKATLTYDYDFSACPASISSSELLGAINSAFTLWNNVSSSNVKLNVGSVVTANFSTATTKANAQVVTNPIIFCDTNFSTDLSVDGNFVVGLDQSYFDSTGKIYFASIALNAETGKSANIANVSASVLSIIVAHETGHSLGFGHSADQHALMYYDATGKNTLNLSQDDVDGLTYLYPRKEPSNGAFGCGSLTTERKNINGQGSSGSGGGSAPAAAETAALLIGFYLIAKTSRLRRFQIIANR